MAIEEILTIHDKATATLKDVADEARKADRAVEDVGASAKNAEDGFGRFGNSTQKVAGALDLIDPRLGEVARGLADVADVGEVASGALGGGGGLAAVLPVLGVALGVAAVAAGEFVGVLNDYTAAEDRARHAAEMHAAALTPLADAIAAERRERDLLLEALNSSDPAGQLALVERRMAIEAQEAKVTADLRAEREQLVAVVEAAGVARNSESLLAEDGIRRIDREIAAVAAQGDELAALQEQTAEIRTVAASYTGELVKQEGALKSGSAAAKAAADAERALKVAMSADEAEIRANLAARAIEREQTEAVMLMAAESEMQAAIDQLAAEQALTQAIKDRRAAQLESVAGAFSTVAGGPSSVMSAVSSSGPWGSIIASLVSIAGDFKGLGDEFNDFTINFNESMAQLPDLLTENLGRWISTGTASVIEMMFANIDAMVDPGMWYGVGESIVEGFISGFTTGRFVGDNGKVTGKSVGMGLLDVFSGGLSGNIDEFSRTGKLGSFDTGTSYVPRTGLYMLHEGEAVDNMQGGGGSQSQRERRGGRASVGGDGRRILLTAEIDLDSYAATIQDARRRGYGV